MRHFKLLFIFLAAGLSLLRVEAQRIYTFTNNNLMEASGGNPLTETLATNCGGTAGSFTTENIVTVAGPCASNSTVFAFNAGGGLAFDNSSSYIGSSYTIYLFFKFSSFAGGYGRIFDFSNSTSDVGIYSLGSCLNFYPNGNVGPCPAFVDGNYYLLTLVRDGATGIIKVYINGALATSYNDASNTYIPATATTPIIFFRDDNVVPCEDRSGHVRYISLSPAVSSDADVATVYANICTIILPITLQSFDAVNNNNQVNLSWLTAEERGVSHYSIERSMDGVNYYSLGHINAFNTAGNHSYKFTDAKPLSGYNYYRLNIIDQDNKQKYSPVKEVTINGSLNYAQVHYAPGYNKAIINISEHWLNSTATLTSMNGQILKTVLLKQSFSTFEMNTYPSGVYLVKIQKGSEATTQKLVKY